MEPVAGFVVKNPPREFMKGISFGFLLICFLTLVFAGRKQEISTSFAFH
jgi:hypothetical protein